MNDAQSCCTFQTITGANTASATATPAQAHGETSTRRERASSSTNAKAAAGTRIIEYLDSMPTPIATPAPIHARERPSISARCR